MYVVLELVFGFGEPENIFGFSREISSFFMAGICADRARVGSGLPGGRVGRPDHALKHPSHISRGKKRNVDRTVSASSGKNKSIIGLFNTVGYRFRFYL